MQLHLLKDQDSENHACATRAREGDQVAEIVALVEKMAAEKRSTRQIAEAVRAFAGERAAPTSPLVWIASGTPEWTAWARYWRATKGKTPPRDRNDGWRFPSRWPPAIVIARSEIAI
jgi:hypothetical protein